MDIKACSIYIISEWPMVKKSPPVLTVMASSYSEQPFSPSNFATTTSIKLWFDHTSTNYKPWKEQMLCLIQSQGLLHFIDGRTPPPPETDDLWRRTDALLRKWILSSLTNDVVYRVCAFKTSGEVWSELERNSRPYFNFPPRLSDWTDVETGRDYAQEEAALLRAALQGDWAAAKTVLDNNQQDSRINLMRRKALLAAAATGKANRFVKELIKEMPHEFLTAEGGSGDTALAVAASVGNTELLWYLANEMPDLLYIPNKCGDFPVQIAAHYAERRALQLLIFVTKADFNGGQNPYAGPPGLRLLLYAIDANFLDIALWLVEQHPQLAKLTLSDGSSALKKISSKKSIFHSARRFSFRERLFSPCMKEGMKKKRLLKKQAIKLVKRVSKEIYLDRKVDKSIYFEACLVATELGLHEIVQEILDVFPDVIYCKTPETNQFLLHVAVKNRSERVYDIICGMGDHVRLFSSTVDSDGNNILHLAGILAPSHKLDENSGAALQMQHELHWYKEVEKSMNPHSREQLNNAGKSPKMIFTEEHQKLKEAGEKWVKDTATSCTIGAALIATVMFAAAITVPGGSDSSKGFPIYSTNKAFTVFAVSDVISVFACTSSLLMFLAILTSRFAEYDFHHHLPRRLMIGLGTLFISITFMMVTFSAAIYLVFGRKKAWVLIPVGGLACLQVTSFAILQFPLLFALVASLYRSGRLAKQLRKRASTRAKEDIFKQHYQKGEVQRALTNFVKMNNWIEESKY